MKRNSTELKVKYHGNKTEKSKGRKKNPNVLDLSKQGYGDDSPHRSMPSIDIHTPNGVIDMSNTGIPLWANGQLLQPYSGQHFIGAEQVKEIPAEQIPLAKTGGWLQKYQTKGSVKYVSNPNDPILQAYRDSSSLYKKTMDILSPKYYDNGEPSWYNFKGTRKEANDFMRKNNIDLDYEYYGTGKFPGKIQPIETGDFGEGMAYPIYKKPVQEVVYEPLTFIQPKGLSNDTEVSPASNPYSTKMVAPTADEIMMPSGQMMSRKAFIKEYGQGAWDRATNKKQMGGLTKAQYGLIGPEEEQKPGVARVMGADEEGTPILRPTTGYYLPEVEISAAAPDTYNNYIRNKYKDAGLGATMFGLPIDYAFGFPQAAMTKAFTGKYQLPSEAMGIENPVVALLTDAALDPVNITGAGLLTKEKALAALASSKESGMLSNAWRLNPMAYQYNLPRNTMWRGLGQEGMEDAVSSGLFRSKQNVVPEYVNNFNLSKDFGINPYFTPKFNTAATYGDDFIAEVPRSAANWRNRYGKRHTWSQVADRPIPIEEGRLLQKDWLRGYKEVPKKEDGGSKLPPHLPEAYKTGGWLKEYQSTKDTGEVAQPARPISNLDRAIALKRQFEEQLAEAERQKFLTNKNQAAVSDQSQRTAGTPTREQFAKQKADQKRIAVEKDEKERMERQGVIYETPDPMRAQREAFGLAVGMPTAEAAYTGTTGTAPALWAPGIVAGYALSKSAPLNIFMGAQSLYDLPDDFYKFAQDPSLGTAGNLGLDLFFATSGAKGARKMMKTVPVKKTGGWLKRFA